MSSSTTDRESLPRGQVRVQRDECPDCGAEIKSLEISFGGRQHEGLLCECTLEIESHNFHGGCPVCDLFEEVGPEDLEIVHSHRDARSVVWQSADAQTESLST